MMKKLQWGFDLTDFGSAERFKSLLKRHGLLGGYKRIKPYTEHPDVYFYTWSNSKLSLTTGNNPLTGKYSTPRMRPDEKGYASYIGIEGEPEAVMKLAKDIRNTAEFIKDESPQERDFI